MKNKKLYPLITIIMALILWEIFVRVFNIPGFVLPLPSKIITYIVFNTAFLLKHTSITLYEVFVGFSISIILALSLAILMIYSKTIENIFLPIIVITQTFPAVAIAPLLVIWFGFGYLPKIIITVFISFFPLFINALRGLTLIEKNLIYLMHSLNATKTQILLKIRFPKSLPYLFAGLKTGIILAIIGAIVSEFISAKHGLGYLILIGKAQINNNIIFSALIILGIIGFLLYSIINFLENIVLNKMRMKQELKNEK